MSQIKEPFANGDKTPSRINQLSTLYKDLENTKVQKDIEVFKHEAEQLKSYESQIKEIQDLIQKYKIKVTNNLTQLNAETKSFNADRLKHQETMAEYERASAAEKAKVNELMNQYHELGKKRVSLANALDVKSLNKIEIENRKSDAHDLFKWIIMVIYKEPTNKYYLDNFKTQAFMEDKGFDFKERMGKVSAAELKEEERLATESLLARKELMIKHPDLSKSPNEIEKVMEIAYFFNQASTLAKKIKEVEVEVNKNKTQRQADEEVYHKINNRFSAIDERILLNQKYLKVLEDIERRLSAKGQSYSMIEGEGQRLIAELNNVKSQTSSIWFSEPAQYNTQTESRDNCSNCSIF